MRYGKQIAVGGAIVATGVLALATYGLAGDRSSKEGVAEGVSSLTRVHAAEERLPVEVQFRVGRMAMRSGMSKQQALDSVRVLRSNLGELHSDFFAFETPSGGVCWGLTEAAGSCPRDKFEGTEGFQWTIGGGYETTPGVLAGIAADDVTRIELFTDGVEQDVSMVNNAVFAEYPQGAKKAEIVVHRADGSSKSTSVLLNG